MAAVAALSLAIASAMACTWAKLVRADSECTAGDKACYGSGTTAEADPLVMHAGNLARKERMHECKTVKERKKEQKKERKQERKNECMNVRVWMHAWLQQARDSRVSVRPRHEQAGLHSDRSIDQGRPWKAELVPQCCLHMPWQVREMMVKCCPGHKFSQQRSYAQFAACRRRHCTEPFNRMHWTEMDRNWAKEGKGKQGKEKKEKGGKGEWRDEERNGQLRIVVIMIGACWGDTQEQEMLTLVWCWAASMMTPASSCWCLDSAALSARKRWATSPLSAVISPCTTNMWFRLMGMLLGYTYMLWTAPDFTELGFD